MKRKPSNPMVVPLIVATSLFMQNLDTSIINTALPSIAHSFGDNPVRLSLAVTSYMLSLAVFIPISGWIADRYGAASVFRAAIALFTLASMLCGLTNSTMELTAARVLQGVGGAMMVPVGRLVIMRSIDRSDLVRAISYLTTPAILGPILGPPVGGLITTYLSWRWTFFLNVPVGVLGIVLVSMFIEDTKPEESPALDWKGFLYTGIALACLMYGFDLIAHPTGGWLIITAILAAGAALGWTAVRHAKRHPAPLIDLSLMKIETFRVNMTAGTVFRMTSGVMPFLLPMMLQVGFGLSAFNSGLITFAGSLGSFFNKMTTAPVLRRFGYRTTFIVNTAIAAVFVGATGLFTAQTPALLMFVVLAVGGFFRSLQFTAMNSMVFAEIPSDKMSPATSLSSMVQQLTNGMGIAFAAIVVHVIHVTTHGNAATFAPSDFQWSFVAVAVMSFAAIPWYWQMDPAAGWEVTGHRPAGQDSTLEGSPAE